MNDTPTPRTDEAVWHETDVVEASFARQLERELAAVTEQLTKSCMREKLADEDRKYVENQRDDAFFQLAEAQDKLAAVTKQRDRLAEAYGRLKETIQNFLQILRIQEESENGRVFFPNAIHSCRTHDLERINVLLNRMEEIMYPKGGSDE